MSCPTKTYPVTPEQFAALGEKAKQHGLLLVGESGIAKVDDCAFQWTYADGVLSITCTHKPFLVGCETVSDALDRVLAL